VRELWREEKKVWEEIHPDGEEEDDEQHAGENDEVQAQKKNGTPEVEIGLEELTIADEIEKKQ
jgi:hypothetical protein